MSTKNNGKIKFILSILAVTSIAALNPSASAQNIKPGNVNNFLTRAKLNTNYRQLERREINNIPSAVERLPNEFKLNGSEDKSNGVCDGVCARKPNAERELKENPINRSGSFRNLSLPQIRQ